LVSGRSRVSFWRFLDELRRRNVSLKYSMTDAESEIDRLLARKMSLAPSALTTSKFLARTGNRARRPMDSP